MFFRAFDNLISLKRNATPALRTLGTSIIDNITVEAEGQQFGDVAEDPA